MTWRKKLSAIPETDCIIHGVVVLLAAYIVTSMPIYYVRWLVIVVVIYTAITMMVAGLSADERAGA